MSIKPLTIEKRFDAPAAQVWQAITDNRKMKLWYFDIPAFKPEVGFEFQFYGGSEDKKYLHVCKVTEVIPGRKIAYTWKYKDYTGDSELSFELFPEGEKTLLKLVHTGLETFPQNDRDFAKESFMEGWTFILGKSLKNFVEAEAVKK